MNLYLFKKLCCFLPFWTIFCKMAWSSAHKTNFWSLFFILLLPKKFLPWSCMVSPFQRIFLEMISSFCWTVTIFLITLYLQIFPFATIFESTMNFVNFWKKKKKFSSYRAFLEQWAHASRFLPRRLVAGLFFRGSSCREFHLSMVLGGS